MNKEKTLDAIKNTFGDTLLDVFERSERRVYVTVDKEDVPAICRYLFKERGGRLCTASGIDTRSGIEILYHFMFVPDHLIITVKTKVDKPSPEIESIGTFLPAAVWIEREIFDILGVTFTNHPDPRRLIMADDWPEGVYPFRRDFKGVD